jgi:hypothetical protein
VSLSVGEEISFVFSIEPLNSFQCTSAEFFRNFQTNILVTWNFGNFPESNLVNFPNNFLYISSKFPVEIQKLEISSQIVKTSEMDEKPLENILEFSWGDLGPVEPHKPFVLRLIVTNKTTKNFDMTFYLGKKPEKKLNGEKKEMTKEEKNLKIEEPKVEEKKKLYSKKNFIFFPTHQFCKDLLGHRKFDQRWRKIMKKNSMKFHPYQRSSMKVNIFESVIFSKKLQNTLSFPSKRHSMLGI